jgi:myo-inositol-1(or 4)-monophosphatase
LAAGRFDAFWERDLSPWDMAAGVLMIREAGGFATDLDGGDGIFAKRQVIAGNEFLHKTLIQVLKEART